MNRLIGLKKIIIIMPGEECRPSMNWLTAKKTIFDCRSNFPYQVVMSLDIIVYNGKNVVVGGIMHVSVD